MNSKLTRSFAVFALLLILALQITTPVLGQRDAVVAFVNVTLIPKDADRLLETQTVLVQGDRITAIGPAADIDVPDGAHIVDSSGLYMIPGLADFHVHPEGSQVAMNLLLANGVTTARGLNSTPDDFAMRAMIENGEALGPTLFSRTNYGRFANTDYQGHQWHGCGRRTILRMDASSRYGL